LSHYKKDGGRGNQRSIIRGSGNPLNVGLKKNKTSTARGTITKRREDPNVEGGGGK